MKRAFAMLLSVLMVLSLLPAVTFGAQTDRGDMSGILYAGYSKVRVDPSAHPDGEMTGLPMAGSGATTTRLSTGTMDDTGDGRVTAEDGLFATCIAITDQYDRTILYIGMDFINAYSSWAMPAKVAMVKALAEAGYDLDADDIYMCGSHTHSAPDMTYGASFSKDKLAGDEIARKMNTYRAWVTQMLSQAAVEAVQDREEVTLTKGVVDVSDAIKALNPNATTNQQRMNYTRHYKSVRNGETVYGGDNFGYINNNSEDTAMVWEPVDLMHLVQFTPKSGHKAPIVLVNWNAHPIINFSSRGNADHYLISSDYINGLRIGLAKEGYRAAFSQGAAGISKPTTSVKHLKNPDILDENGQARGDIYGTRLSEIAAYGLENSMSDPLDTSYVRTVSAQFCYETNVPTAEEATLVTAMLAADPSTYPSGYTDLVTYLGTDATTWGERSAYYGAFPYLKNINSRYQLNSIKSRMSNFDMPEASVSVGVIAVGKELSFVVSPNEMSDRYSATDTLENVTDNDWLDLMDDDYGMPIIMGYASNGAGYIPHQLAYTYNEGSTQYAVGSYESQTSKYARGSGEKLLVFFAKLLDCIHTDQVRHQCICGGKAVSGQNGHVCKQEEFLPWDDAATLPDNGNYYLTTDIVTTTQMPVSGRLCLDLNGHNITHKVSAVEGEKAQAGKSHNTRVFNLGANAYLSITDSTDAPGTVSRDLSNLTKSQEAKITNYGLIMILMGEHSTGVLFDGILDATGMTAGGGGVICNHASATTFKMYGGTLKGAIANAGAVIYTRGHAELYGGLVTGGVTKTAAGNSPGIQVATNNGIPGKLTLGGTVRIENNKRSDGSDANIYFNNTDPAQNLIIKENFTGKVGIYIPSRSSGKIIGICENPNITAKNIGLDYHNDYDIIAENGKLVLSERKTAAVVNGSAVTRYDTLTQAIAAYPGGDAVLRLLRDNYETVTIPADAKLDLAGWNLAGRVTLGGKLFAMDSATDDFTTEDVAGCGTVPTSDAIAPMPGYLMAVGADGLSFHRLSLDTIAVTLRPSDAGLYFQSRFGGDEYVKSMVKSYGVALGAGHKPNYAPGTYTAFDGSTWVTGADMGSLRRGTLLKDVLKKTNTDSENETNAETVIYGHAYAELTDGTRYVGDLVSLTFRSVLEGNDQTVGADSLWDQLNSTQRNGLSEMYAAYKPVMRDWNIPNIKSSK